MKVNTLTHERLVDRKKEDETMDSMINKGMGFKISPLCSIGKHEKCIADYKDVYKCECACHGAEGKGNKKSSKKAGDKK